MTLAQARGCARWISWEFQLLLLGYRCTIGAERVLRRVYRGNEALQARLLARAEGLNRELDAVETVVSGRRANV